MPDQTTPATPPPAEQLPEAASGRTDIEQRKYVENKPPRGLYVRVFLYVVATHVLLAFMSLLVVIAKTR
ncbi:DUF6126 family protein [Streptomyces sioyaensis]|uniref:DUF6126 family protein n=1 Tax=Streptomyces sioyaensis TaxID=67364 RepID=UPI00379AB3A8